MEHRRGCNFHLLLFILELRNVFHLRVLVPERRLDLATLVQALVARLVVVVVAANIFVCKVDLRDD